MEGRFCKSTAGKANCELSWLQAKPGGITNRDMTESYSSLFLWVPWEMEFCKVTYCLRYDLAVKAWAEMMWITSV